MTTDEIIQAFQKVKTEDPKTYYNAMGAGDDGINIMHPFIGDSYALGLVAGAKYALEHFTKCPPHQVDLLCAGLGALSKRVKDRIKNNDKYPDRPNSAKHKAHNEARLQEIETLLQTLKTIE